MKDRTEIMYQPGKPLTLEEAKELKPGDILFHREKRNADGTMQRWKVNGQVKTWKRDPGRIRVPVKHGLYDYGVVDADTIERRVLTRTQYKIITIVEEERG